MNRTLLLICLLLGLIPPDKKDIRCFRYTVRVPIIDNDGTFKGNYDFVDDKIFTCGDLMMYQRVTHYMEHIEPDSNKYEDWYEYLVFHKDSTNGIRYFVHFPDSTNRFIVDTIAKGEGMSDVQIKQLISDSSRLAASSMDMHGGLLRKAYVRIGNEEKSDKDTAFLYFSKPWRTLPARLSLNHTQDSIQQMKLYEIRCVMGPGFNKKINKMIGATEIRWMLEEQAFFNRDSALMYFNRYLKDTHSIH